MNFIKKCIFLICIILVFFSLYNDLKKDVLSERPGEEVQEVAVHGMKAIQVKVVAGDTVLSVSERLNGNKLKNIQIEKIMTDFERVNPTIDAYHLTIGGMYYFPLY